jgi:hypothetical protein
MIKEGKGRLLLNRAQMWARSQTPANEWPM